MESWFHADTVEVIFLGTCLLALGYALRVRHTAVVDYRERDGNGSIELLGRAVVRRTTAMVRALCWFTLAGIASVLMNGDATALTDQAVVFRLLVLVGVVELMLKLRREQIDRTIYTAYQARPNKRVGDPHPGPVPVEPPDTAA